MSDFLLKNIVSKLHSKTSLILGYGVGILAFASIDGFLEGLISDNRYRFLIYGLLFLAWTGYWLFHRFKLPRNKKDKLGLVIAIYAESTHEEKRLKSDLVSQLQKSISAEGFGELINIIVLKNHQSEKIKGIKELNKVHEKVRGHFYLFGQVKRRKNREMSYYLDLDGMVIHKPINLQLSSELSRDFISVLPKQISFYETVEFKGFELTTNIIYLAVKYITGVAAFISGDPFLAIRLHENLEKEFQNLNELPPSLQKVRNKAKLLLADEKLIIARTLYSKGDASFQNWLNESFSINPSHYGAFLFKAIVEFQSGKPIEALKTIRHASKFAKSTFEWRYSEVFLLFWLEDYPKAFVLCGKIAKSNYKGEDLTISEVEDFNLHLLRKEQVNKPQLYFWLGYLNYRKKKNYPLALEYFEEFEKFGSTSIPFLRQKTSAYLQEIRKEMKI